MVWEWLSPRDPRVLVSPIHEAVQPAAPPLPGAVRFVLGPRSSTAQLARRSSAAFWVTLVASSHCSCWAARSPSCHSVGRDPYSPEQGSAGVEQWLLRCPELRMAVASFLSVSEVRKHRGSSAQYL